MTQASASTTPKRRDCKKCVGSSIYKHNRQKRSWTPCGGSSICEHSRIRSQCNQQDFHRHESPSLIGHQLRLEGPDRVQWVATLPAVRGEIPPPCTNSCPDISSPTAVEDDKRGLVVIVIVISRNVMSSEPVDGFKFKCSTQYD
jgi:hypothetical protein